MHESSLAKQILEAILEQAEAEGAARVRAARGWVAETESLSIDTLTFHFEAHARGTRAEGARLDLRPVLLEARCKECGGVYSPEHHLCLCPSCGSNDGELLGRKGLGIEALEVE